jgi:hypothetical protein
MTEGIEQTPEQLLNLILVSNEAARLRICRTAVLASKAASECFMAGHTIEIDNLRRHIEELSRALVDCAGGRPIDPGVFKTAVDSVNNSTVEGSVVNG